MTAVFIRLLDDLNVQDGIESKVCILQMASQVPNKCLNDNCAQIAPASTAFSDNNHTVQ